MDQPPTSVTGPAVLVPEIWRRHVDLERQARHRRRLVWFYAVPTLALVVVAAVVWGPGEALGVLILLGGIGGMLAAWVLLLGRSVRMNPAVMLDGRDLVWAKHRVDIDQVATFTAGIGTETVSTADVTTTTEYGYCDFTLVDGTTVRFRWAHLPRHELDGLTGVLVGLLPGRFTAPG